jgi:DNA invertase Pin-like site-specific DNA recombinase
MTKAIAYLRTSSITNVGPDKDSDARQRDAIAAYAARSGIEVVAEFYDAAVKGRSLPALGSPRCSNVSPATACG